MQWNNTSVLNEPVQQSSPVQPVSHRHRPGDAHFVQWLQESEQIAKLITRSDSVSLYALENSLHIINFQLVRFFKKLS